MYSNIHTHKFCTSQHAHAHTHTHTHTLHVPWGCPPWWQRGTRRQIQPWRRFPQAQGQQRGSLRYVRFVSLAVFKHVFTYASVKHLDSSERALDVSLAMLFLPGSQSYFGAYVHTRVYSHTYKAGSCSCGNTHTHTRKHTLLKGLNVHVSLVRLNNHEHVTRVDPARMKAHQKTDTCMLSYGKCVEGFFRVVYRYNHCA
jgi:hypothetical protein